MMIFKDIDILVPLSDGLDTSKIEHFDVGGQPWGMRLKKGADDNFSDGVMGFPWASIYGSASYLNEADGVLHLFPEATAGYDSEVLTGDFDIEFDFTNYSYSGSNWGEFQIWFLIDGNTWARMGWVKNSSYDMWQSIVYLNGTQWDAPNGPRYGYTSGAFRIARTGSLIQTWYKLGGGGWNLATNKSGYTTANGYVRIRANGMAGYPLIADVDNFKFNSGGIYYSDSPSPGDPGWLSLSVGSIIQRSTAVLPEDFDGGDTGSIEIAEAVNGGGWGSWQSLAAYQAAGDVEITDSANSYKALVRLNSDGAQAITCLKYLTVGARVVVTTVFKSPAIKTIQPLATAKTLQSNPIVKVVK